LKILVTGASGFVGQALCRQLVQEGQHEVVAAVRSPASVVTGGTRCVVGDIGSHTAWEKATEGADAVVHLAGRAHIMHDTACDRLAAYRAINTEGTLALARRALASGVKRLLFVSSIKVCGEGQLKSSTDPYNEASPASPSDAYAISKWEGELGLWAAAKDTGLEVVVLRPPLIYGPGVRANFLRLMTLVDRGWPLPFGGVRNHRDLLYLGNLVDAILTAVVHPAAKNKTFLLSDNQCVTTPELVRRIASALERPARLWSVSEKCLRLAGRVIGKGATVDRVLGSMRVDSRLIHRDLGWSPPFSMQEGLRETAKWYRRTYSR
jgi:Nucleoside-diphosphate-sugar epimerases